MALVYEYFHRLKEGAEAFKKAQLPSEWEIKRIQECLDGLFSFANFKVGDLVEMKETYPVNSEDSWGWMSYRHLLKKGSKAEVKGVDFYEGKFVYLIEFLEKSWIDDKNVIHPLSTCTQFNLSQRWLAPSKKKVRKSK